MSRRVLESIRRHLGELGVSYSELVHERVTTSEEAARPVVFLFAESDPSSTGR